MRNTRFKDKNNNPIHEGDYIHVHDDLYDFEGIVEWVYDAWRDKNRWYVVYYDIGEREPIPLCRFTKENREILNGRDEYERYVRQIVEVMNR